MGIALSGARGGGALRHQGYPAGPFAGRWLESTIVCIASGPSLADGQIEVVRQARERGVCRVIAVNDNWRRAPFADVLYACDERWWDRYLSDIRAAGFTGELWSCNRRAHARHGTLHVLGLSKPGLSHVPNIIHHGGNSGYQAVGLAHQFGAARIVLIGYDMQRTAGKAHWFGDHPAGFTNSPGVAGWVPRFDQLAKDAVRAQVEIINCTLETALTCFRRANIEDVL